MPAKRQDIESPVFKSFAEFWPYYLAQHAQTRTRWLHVVGLVLAIVVIAIGVLRGSLRLFPLALIVGYLPAWLAHFFIERNRPATWRFPFYSLVGDFKMTVMLLMGKLGGHFHRKH